MQVVGVVDADEQVLALTVPEETDGLEVLI